MRGRGGFYREWRRGRESRRDRGRRHCSAGIVGGLSFQVMEDGAEGVGGGDGAVEGEALVEDPLTEGAGADGEGEMAAGLGGNGDEGASADGSEGGAALGDAEEGVEAGWGFGWGMHKDGLQFDV
jgi:hypothetical protein